MVAQAPMTWRELAQFDDLPLARAVATSIAAMEFEVRLQDGRVEVHGAHWDDLAEVLQEIIDEQVEFDRRLAERDGGCGTGVVIFITLTGAVDIMALLALLDI
jgi:hypothetical protein